MNIKQEVLPKSQVKLMITIEKAEFEKFKKQAFQKLANEVNLPGFRKGHVPEQMVRERYREELIVAEAADMAIPKLLAEAVLNEKLQIIDRPDVSLDSVDPFAFSAVFTVLPEVTLGSWREIQVPANEIKVTPEQINEVVGTLQDRFQTRKAVDRPAREKDFVEVDFAGTTPDGVPLDGATSRMHPVILGSGTLIPGFEEKLIGLKKGEEKTFTITFPADYHAKHLASKDIVFAVKLNSVFEHEKPPVDEAFAEQLFGKKMTVAELETEIEKILHEKAEGEERTRRENELVTTWAKLAKVELPDILVQEELARIQKDIEQQAQRAEIPWEQFLANMKKTQEDFENEMRPQAIENVKQRLVVQKIIREADITISKEDITAAIADHNAHSGHHHSADDKEYEAETAARLKVARLFDSFLGKEKVSDPDSDSGPKDELSSIKESEQS